MLFETHLALTEIKTQLLYRYMYQKPLKFTILATGLMAMAVLGSCTNELEPTRIQTGNRNMLAKAPEMMAYTGQHHWGTSTSTRASETNWQQYKKVQDYDNKNSWSEWDIANDPYYPYKDNAPAKTDRGESVSQAEYDYVMEYIRTHQGGVECHLDTYFIQNVGSSYDHYKYEYHDSNNNVDRSVEFIGGNQMDYLVIGDYHIGDYNASGGPRALCINMPINAPEVSPTYHDSWGTVEQTKEDAYRFYIITLPDDPIYGENAGKTAYYLGFDYSTKKWDNGDIDYQGDGIYNDWVVKIMPADGSIVENPGESENPEKPEIPGGGEVEIPDNPIVPFPGLMGVCILCGHEHEAGTSCEECEDEDHTCLGQQGDSNTGAPKVTDEVEINLALDKKLHDFLESHLSIHVRTATDVEVFLPVPKQYYCAADDMAIVMQHDVEFIHGGPYKTVYKIGENEVSLNVEFQDNGIRVWTDGITQEVIDYCRDNYGDGITFEIWNYFNDPQTGLPYISLEELKEYLDKATVRFIDKIPDSYVNAFGKDNDKYSDSNPDGKDFHVVPDDSQTKEFTDPVNGPHYNGSDKNEIYTKK